MPTLTHVGIVGEGAIGLGLAALLSDYAKQNNKDTLDIRLFGRVAKHGSYTVAHNHDVHNYQFKVCSLSDEDALNRLAMLIIPVKHYQLAELTSQLKPYLNADVALLILQNGFGGHELLAQVFADNPLYIGSTTDAIERTGPYRFDVHARGELRLGSLRYNKNHTVVEHLRYAHPHAVWDESIVNYLYKKLAVNAVINPLTAIHQCRNGELIEHTDETKALKNEVFSIYQALALNIDHERLGAYVDHVIELTASNYSSMYQDVKHQRPTELEGILGVLQTKAAHFDISVPAINGAYKAVKALESAYS